LREGLRQLFELFLQITTPCNLQKSEWQKPDLLSIFLVSILNDLDLTPKKKLKGGRAQMSFIFI
jgi:hypothetical protein